MTATRMNNSRSPRAAGGPAVPRAASFRAPQANRAHPGTRTPQPARAAQTSRLPQDARVRQGSRTTQRPGAPQAGRVSQAGRTAQARPLRGSGQPAALPARRAPVKQPQPKPRRQARAAARILTLAAVLAVALLLLRGRRFVLGEVKVEGNETYSDAQIAAMAGLQMGESIFDINENAVARGFPGDGGVQLLDVRVEMPDTVTLVVSERQARAAVNCAGVILLVDEEGRIMDRLSSVPESGVIVVSGLDVSVSAQGRQIETAKTWQLRDMRAILAALDERGMTALMSELNLSDRFNIYLVSRTGVQIMLGDEENLADKLVWAQTVLEKLTQEGIRRGVLDVSTGKNAVYADR